jgi:AraC family transcriptional regulator of adaptative response / DNA-3-methyladenine glycosylase II
MITPYHGFEQGGTAPLTELGLTPREAETIRTVAAAVANGHGTLGSAANLTEAIEQLMAYSGIGVWAANMIAMRALGEPEAFPAGDPTLRRVAATRRGGPLTDAQLLEQAEAWRPWRASAAMYLWIKALATCSGWRLFTDKP